MEGDRCAGCGFFNAILAESREKKTSLGAEQSVRIGF